MTTKRDQGAELDDLLRKSLPDDLPADVRAGMRERIDRFRAATLKGEEKAAPWAGLFRKSAWAALSILMLVFGSVLQGLGARNALADGISLIGTRQALESRLAAAESMSCQARIQDEAGRFLSMEILWRKGEIPQARVFAPDGSLLGTFEIGVPAESDSSWLQAAASFSDPQAIQRLLARDWKLFRFTAEEGSQTGIFTTPAGTGSDRLEFAVDLGTYLPLRIVRKTGGMEAFGGASHVVWEARFGF